MKSKQEKSFHDDSSYVDGLADNIYIYDFEQQQESCSEHISDPPKNQTELGRSNTKTSFAQKSHGTNSADYATDTIQAGSEYAYPQEYNFEDQVANFAYVDDLKPLYDPNNMTKENVPTAGGMIVPMMQGSNINNDYAASISKVEPPNNFVAAYNNPKGHIREQRIRELKNEIDELDFKVESENLQESNQCCGCCPTTKKGKLIVLFIVLFFLATLGILIYVFFPIAPDMKIYIGVKDGPTPQFNTTGENAFRFKYVLSLNITVKNDNRYAIKPEKITVLTYISPDLMALSKTKFPGNMLTDDVDDSLAGWAEEAGRKIFPSKSTTNFTMDLNIDFQPDEKLGAANDPAVGEILRVCHPEAIKRKDTMKIIYEAFIEVALIEKLGLPKLKKVEAALIRCPLGQRYAAELFKDPMMARFL